MEHWRKIVRNWPITVEMYQSGTIGFVARPGGQRNRVNKNFSRAKYGSEEEAAQAAIAFCKQHKRGEYEKALRFSEAHPIPDEVRAHLSILVKQATDAGVDPVQAMKSGILVQMRTKMRGPLK